jgi:xanthine dehydrogenase molybdopterin-binding subunit B
MLAISVFLAIRDAVGSCGEAGNNRQVKLSAPATAEAVLGAIVAVRS